MELAAVLERISQCEEHLRWIERTEPAYARAADEVYALGLTIASDWQEAATNHDTGRDQTIADYRKSDDDTAEELAPYAFR